MYIKGKIQRGEFGFVTYTRSRVECVKCDRYYIQNPSNPAAFIDQLIYDMKWRDIGGFWHCPDCQQPCPRCKGTGRVRNHFVPLPWDDCPDCKEEASND
jgi:hypothetical protein